MFQDLYPSPRTGGPLRSGDKPDWFGVRGDESRLVRCQFCGWICDPRRDMQLEDGNHAGKGIDYGSQKSDTLVLGGKTVTIYYYEPEVVAGCPQCGSMLYNG